MELQCKKCFHKWVTRKDALPKVCPSCKRETWNEALKSKDVSVELNRRCNEIILKAGGIDQITMAPQLLLFVIVSFCEAEKAFSENIKDRFDGAIEAFEMLEGIRDLVSAKVLPIEMYNICRRLSISYFNEATPVKIDPITESDIHKNIVKKWDESLLSDLMFIGSEVVLPDLDKIDILAKDKDGRDVIVEIKKGNKDGYKQLRAYAVFYDNPRLINLSEIPVKKKKMGIEYRSLSQEQ